MHTKHILVNLPQFTDLQKERLQSEAQTFGYTVSFLTGEEAITAAKDAEILLTGDFSCIQAATNMQWLHVPSAGVDAYLDEKLYPSPETLLTSSSGAYGLTISEHVIMVLLEMMRHQGAYSQIVAQRRWQRDLSIDAIYGSRITLIGTGNIGQEIAHRLTAFAPASIWGVNRSGNHAGAPFEHTLRFSDREALMQRLKATDVLILSLPGTRETYHLLDAELLSCLPEHAYLVNVGRGSTIDQAALLTMLQDEKLAGAALDVFEKEPIPQDDPIWSCPRVLITPHCSGNMTLKYTVDKILDIFLRNLTCYAHHQPMPTQIDRHQGY